MITMTDGMGGGERIESPDTYYRGTCGEVGRPCAFYDALGENATTGRLARPKGGDRVVPEATSGQRRRTEDAGRVREDPIAPSGARYSAGKEMTRRNIPRTDASPTHPVYRGSP